MDATRQDLTAAIIAGRQMKDELAKQSGDSDSLNEKNTPAIVTNIQNAEKMKNLSEEVTTIKEELAQEVTSTQQNLEMTLQKFEKELTTVKEEIQTCRSEARKAKDKHNPSLVSIEAKLTHSQLASQYELGKVSDKLTQQIKNIENIKQDLIIS